MKYYLIYIIISKYIKNNKYTDMNYVKILGAFAGSKRGKGVL